VNLRTIARLYVGLCALALLSIAQPALVWVESIKRDA
jgi:hypothetical protein